MPVVTYLIVAAVAYLLGSIPFGYILVRLFRNEDIRAKGSGNIGATNVVRSGAKGLGALTFLLDVCKGYLAVFLCGHLAAISSLTAIPAGKAEALAALCVILGHIYTVWLGFKGGKGVATALGVFLALALWPALAAMGIFIIVFALSRYVSLGSILAAIAFPVFAFLLPHAPRDPWLSAVMVIAPLIVIAKHHQNIGRLLQGREYRFGKSDKTSGTAAA
ncbi:glycerol-3-phosphate 1-O-acyltransferase PlsY [Paracidobacterium acidisoli]|uniref:Glycerol-3-phosphate acyltransferase n=1 Tax=Paracidobacterium acidisoli TaxID=2303751 RepID=A0A372ITU4_9BACT|nr:glycerol-3-phosphate 1-O-acyltransferase PlsY [Paracidobacterium acidisoli]MBT9329634.1 glycerol-3-phosphate 1-O-acyltransferase PlsY [Paracidobacterium acidisoli]